MENLNVNDKVLYFDGSTHLELTSVREDLENGTVKLANGIICSKEVTKKSGNYKRKDYLRGSKFKGWIKKYDENLELLYQAYLFKTKWVNTLQSLKDSLIRIDVNQMIEKEGLVNQLISLSKNLDKLVTKCKQL